MIYLYKNPKTGEIKEVHQKMQESHTYNENGVQFERIFTKPQSIIDSSSKLDPSDAKDFASFTSRKKGSIGNLYDLSAELSEKRKEKFGKDPVKEGAMDKYEKSRVKGSIHPDRQKEQLKNALKKSKAFDVEL